MEGFIPHIIGNTETTAFYSYPADDLTYKVGEALVLSSGHLVAATGTTKPEFFSCQNLVIGTDGLPLIVTPVRDDIIYETTNSAEITLASVPIGSKLTLHTNGTQVTATTTSGVAEVVEIIPKAGSDSGKAAVGSIVRVKFA